MNEKIVYTTEKDFSAKYFAEYGWKILLYSTAKTPLSRCRYLYLRDPFNDIRERERERGSSVAD